MEHKHTKSNSVRDIKADYDLYKPFRKNNIKTVHTCTAYMSIALKDT